MFDSGQASRLNGSSSVGAAIAGILTDIHMARPLKAIRIRFIVPPSHPIALEYRHGDRQQFDSALW